MCVCMHACMCVRACMCVCVRACVRVCVYTRTELRQYDITLAVLIEHYFRHYSGSGWLHYNTSSDLARCFCVSYSIFTLF